MAKIRTVIPQVDDQEIRKALKKRYGEDARIEVVERTDFLGQTWKEAVIET